MELIHESFRHFRFSSREIALMALSDNETKKIAVQFKHTLFSVIRHSTEEITMTFIHEKHAHCILSAVEPFSFGMKLT